MKTPKDWIQSKTRLANKLVITDRFSEDDIRAIQLDAGGRADDGEAITEEWLVSVGIEEHLNDSGGVMGYMPKNTYRFFVGINGGKWFCCGILISTRRDIRDLARLLRVKLNE